jgi:hypothetical protein
VKIFSILFTQFTVLMRRQRDSREAQGPIPVRLMLCGLVGSLPKFTAMLALSADPAPVALNVIAIVHDEFAAAVALQVPPDTAKSPELAPLKLSLRGKATFDRLVTVTFKVSK